MLDTETMGTGSYAAMVSLGAVRFDPNGKSVDITDSFYTAITLKSSMKAGLRVDADTIEWWLDPERAAARDAFLSVNKVDLDEALLGFSEWYGDDDTVPVWGNGATFDNVILSNAYQAVGIDRPWGYRADRCFRTIVNIVQPPVKKPPYGVSHHALDDAIAQALYLQKIVRLRMPFFVE
jgi:DNA polymerase III epsilon subunit-like protein